MRFLLDTNIISYCMKGMHSSIIDYMRLVPSDEIGIPAIVYAELEYGAVKSNNYSKYKEKIDQFVNAFQVVPFGNQSAVEYGKLRSKLSDLGCIIGANDMLIAAIALAEDATLVTNNTKEFSRIEGLRVEDWTNIEGAI